MTIRKKIITLILIITATSGIIIYLVILPTLFDIKKINETIYNERIGLEKKYIRGQLLKKTVEDFDKIKGQINYLSNSFLVIDKELEFITNLEKIASANSIEQTIALDINRIKKRENYKEIPITLEIQGNFIQTMSYLNDLEKLSYYITLDALKINAISPEAGADQLKTVISGQIYAIDEPNQESQ